MNAKKFNVESVSKNISNELLPLFDKCFLMPLPKFEDSSKYEEEIISVSKELRISYLKNRIKEISTNLKDNENDEQVEKLREEISSITSQISST